MMQGTTKPKTAFAEIVFPEYGIKALGGIVSMDTYHFGILITEGLEAFAQLPKEAEGSLFFTFKGFLHQAVVRFSQMDENTALVEIVQVLYSKQHRKSPRITISLVAPWRVYHSTNLCSAWLEGVTEDISATGMRLIVPNPQEIPHQIEAMVNIHLDAQALENRTFDEAYRRKNNRSEGQPIKIRGTVKHAKPLPNGLVAFGVLFSKMADIDRMRLLRFLADKTEEIEMRKTA